MNILIGLCLVSLQLVSGISHSSIFKQPENVIFTILNIFKHNSKLIHNVDEEVNVPIESFLFEGRNDELCVEQVNTIMRGVNNSELWAIQSEFFSAKYSF